MDKPMSFVILISAFLLDLLVGDPEKLPHPVRLMGKGILFFEPGFRKLPCGTQVNGLVFALFLIGLSLISSLFLIQAMHALHPALGTISEIVLLYFCVSVKSLKQAAMGVYHALAEEGIDAARQKLKWIVGREVDTLSETGVSRAAVETVAENLVDGVISPLFYGALFGVPFAVCFKMINTLDSMVGYKNDTYIDFGKGAARIDDAANFIPARLSLFVISLAAQLLFKNGQSAFASGLKDRNNHKSPNSGYPEAAFSGALQVRLGGPNRYHGKIVEKPYIGEHFRDGVPDHIKAACRLMMVSASLWVFLLSIITLLRGG
ncbi:MAG: adenosylcobinamide-phosphate synthase CbiB [Proteobacteria bacterium]|nr:adenosylcobinamide-phosphate synthase CbiB [Pseudomonadota bacterium]